MSDLRRLSHGPSITRVMAPEEVRTLFRMYEDRNLVIGAMQTVVTRSAVPSLGNVDCLTVEMTPDQVLQAGSVIARQTMKLHGLMSPPARADRLDDLRISAEFLVDMIRSGALVTHGFDTSRESCVLAVVSALASAANIKEAA